MIHCVNFLIPALLRMRIKFPPEGNLIINPSNYSFKIYPDLLQFSFKILVKFESPTLYSFTTTEPWPGNQVSLGEAATKSFSTVYNIAASGEI